MTQLRNYGITELRDYGITGLRNYRVTEDGFLATRCSLLCHVTF